MELFELLGVSGMRRRCRPPRAVASPALGASDGAFRTLHAALAQARAARGQVGALVGEAGVGKSRLVDEFVQPPIPRAGWCSTAPRCPMARLSPTSRSLTCCALLLLEGHEEARPLQAQ